MRWFWIDRFIEFESGSRAVAIKNVASTEEQLEGYFPGFPVMPAPLIIEGLAQTGGLLVAQHSDFRERVVLAKVSKAVFHQLARPGDTLRYTATIESLQDRGAIVSGQSHIGETLQAEVELFFAYLDERFDGKELFSPNELLMVLRQLDVFEVGRNADGSRITVPKYMADAEQAATGG